MNAALANNIGNMLNRSLNLLKKFCNSEVRCLPCAPGLCALTSLMPWWGLRNSS